MISLTEIVLRLREQCPSFQKRVAGTAEFGAAFQDATADLKLPHCFIVPLEEIDQTELYSTQDDRQQLRNYFATIVAVDNSVNRGKPGGGVARLEPFDKLKQLREEIAKAFAGWEPVQRFDPVRFSRGGSLGLDNKRLWHQWEWYVQEQDAPELSNEMEDEIAAAVEGIETEVPFEQSTLNLMRKIYGHYNVPVPGVTDVGFKETVLDAFPTSVGNPGVVDAGDAARTAEKVAAEKIEVLPTDKFPRKAGPVSHLDQQVQEFLHGEEVEEGPREKPIKPNESNFGE